MTDDESRPLSGAPFDLVDVFAEAPLAGNPLAVVRVERMPDAGLRQAFARETNLSETTFVATAPDADGAWPVRIHTPAEELPFAGHPVLGTAWVVRERLATDAPGRILLATGKGPVPVDFEGTGDGALAWLAAPSVALRDGPDPAALAAALGVPLAALDPDLVAPRFADVGPCFLLAGLRERTTLASLRPDAAPFGALLTAFDATGLLVVAPAAAGEGDLSGRMFFEAAGLREDPATGSAACCLAAVLREAGRAGVVQLAQGVEMQRPSLLRIDLAPGGTRIGGRVFPVLTGRLAGGVA